MELKTVFRYEINIMTGGKIILKKENFFDRVMSKLCRV